MRVLMKVVITVGSLCAGAELIWDRLNIAAVVTLMVMFMFSMTSLMLITAEGWRAILVQCVADLDALFARAPPLPSPVVVFRGTKRQARQEPRGAWYASTSMRREVAEGFANKESPMVLAVDVPRGARPLPLCMVSRYPPEVELLLPKASKPRLWGPV